MANNTLDKYREKYGKTNTSEQSASEQKPAVKQKGTLDKYREKYNNYYQKSAAENLESRIKQYSDNYQKFGSASFAESKKTNFGTIRAQQESRARAASLLRDEAEALKTYLFANRRFLTEEGYNNALDFITQSGYDVDKQMDFFNQSLRYFSHWNTEEAYNADKQISGWYQKYQGKSAAELSAAAEQLEDGEEKDWLAQYAYAVDQEEMSRLDLEEAQAEIDDLIAQQEDYAWNHEFDWTDATQRNAHDAYLADLDDQIAKKKQRMNRAKVIQERNAFAAVADPESDAYDIDFDTLSQYMSTIEGNPTEWSPGAGDVQYEWINNENGFRSIWERNMAMLNALASQGHNLDDTGGTESVYYQKGYDFLNDDEIAIYNYYYNKDGKETAQKYLESIQEILNQRKAKSLYTAMEGRTGQELLFGIEAGLDQFNSGVQGAVKMLMGDDSYVAPSTVQMASGMVREDLADSGFHLPDWLGGASIGQVGYDAVTTTTNMMPSVLTSAAIGMINPTAGAWVGSTLMGVSATGNAYQEAINLGWDKGQAQAYSALVGISEVALSKALGGITKFGGGEGIFHSISLPFLQNVDNAVGRVALKIGANMLDEGLEESLQELLEPWFESVITGAKYEVASADVLYAGLLGMMTAGVIEGPETVSKEWNLYIQGREFQNAGVSSQGLAGIGKSFSMDSEAYRLADKIDENTGAYTMGRLLNEIGVSLTEQNIADIAALLKAKGMDPEIAWKNAMVMAYIADGGVLSDVQMRMIEKNDVLAEVMREVIRNPDSVVNQRTNGYNQVLQQVERRETHLRSGSEQSWRNAAALAKQNDLSIMDALGRAGLSGSADLARFNPQSYARSFQEALKGGASYDQALIRATSDSTMRMVGNQVPMGPLLFNIDGDTNKAVSAIGSALNRAGISMTPGELNLLGIVAAEASAYQQDPSFQRTVAIEMLKENSQEKAWTAASQKLWQEATDRVIAHGVADLDLEGKGWQRQQAEAIDTEVIPKYDKENGQEALDNGLDGTLQTDEWDARNGSPYSLDKSSQSGTIIQDAIDSGQVSTKINREKQLRHTKDNHGLGKSYLYGDLDYAQELVDKHSGKGIPIMDHQGNWTKKEKFDNGTTIGMHTDTNGIEIETSKGIIVYSKTGTHVYPRKEEK